MQLVGGKTSETIHGAALAMALLLCGGASLSTVRAQDNDTPKMEKHLALIIANEDYNLDGVAQTGPADMPPPGYLKDLANPCRDAELFRQTLLDAHWQPAEIIYPGCNQKTSEMRSLITDFREKVVNSSNTLAVFYYSGHGAQFTNVDTSHSFLFGVGAKLDLVAVADSFHNSPGNTSAVANEAIDLDELTTTLGLQTENAVLIILDACRDNPLYGELADMENAPAITALGARRDFNGIVIAYSTPAGEFSGDGFGNHSIYTSALVKVLRPAKTLDSSLNALLLAVAKEYKKAYPYRTKTQTPAMSGRFSGDWCLFECPEEAQAPIATRAYASPVPAGDPHSDAEIRKTSPMIQRAAFSLPSSRASLNEYSPSISYALVSEVSNKSAPQLAAAVHTTSATQVASAPQASSSIRTIYDRDANYKDSSVPASNGMHFDVFWCDGGDGSVDRENHAFEIASALGQEATALQTATAPTSDSNGLRINQFITSVRLRRLTATANTTAGFRYTDDLIIYDKNDPNEVEWSKVVSKLVGPDLKPYGDTATTPNYMSIFVCRAPQQQTKGKTLIYLQVPADNLKPSGHLLLKDLNRRVPTVKDAGGIETRSDGPLSTEVRFYNEEERDAAFAAAKAMEEILKQPVKVQFIPRLANADTAGHMEIWLGKSDPPLDPKALKPKKD